MDTVAAFVIASNLLFTLLMVLSIVRPEHRIWPLEQDGLSARALLNWTFSTVMLAGVPVLAVLDIGTLGLPLPLRILGGLTAVIGLLLTAAGMFHIGVRTSVGYPADLRTTGIYRYTRNPQVLGDVLFMGGIAAAGGSALAFLAAATGALPHLLFPFVEEPWLHERYGDSYGAYRDETPRFMDIRTVRRLLGK